MKIYSRPINVDDIEVKMSITMSIGEWKELKDDLAHNLDNLKLHNAITNMVKWANEHYNAEVLLGDEK